MDCMREFYRSLGALDCSQGKKPRDGMVEEYYLGYCDQYAKEQNLSQGAYN